MRLLRSGEEIERPGAVLTLARLERLARAWYGDRLRGDWRPRTAEESQAVLASVGLTGDFWQLRGAQLRTS
jgi:hypothetical protein